MKINVITVDSGWILQKIAERVCASRPDVFSISKNPKDDVSANFYIDVQNCYHKPSNTADIGFFTHLHENSLRYLIPHWLQLDHIVHMCSRYFNAFLPYYPEEKMSTIMPGEFSKNFQPRKKTIGIFQRGMYEGKGFHFLKKMAEKDILKQFKFLFVGKDWAEVVELFHKKGVEVEYQEHEVYEKYPDLYSKIDYLLIPSLWEAGPMATIEALSCGIPIIASNVGWMGLEIKPDFIFNTNNDIELELILNTILNKIKSRVDQIKELSYTKYSNKIIEIVESI